MALRIQIVIPARLASTRLPEKLLRIAGGKSILQHTYEQACRSRVADSVIVAVDHRRLADEVDAFGGRWLMTSPDCASGTDRIAEVASQMPEIDLFVNVQGDEPEIDPAVIDDVAQALVDDPDADLATAGTPIRDPQMLLDPACVKIVLAADRPGQGRAIYFSRAPVPHCRDGLTAERCAADPPWFWLHIGMYAYRREFLKWFSEQPPSRLEQSERLEQLRAIEAGKRIVVTRVEAAAPGIDTPADLEGFLRRLNAAER